jgi:hypothetical protein
MSPSGTTLTSRKVHGSAAIRGKAVIEQEAVSILICECPPNRLRPSTGPMPASQPAAIYLWVEDAMKMQKPAPDGAIVKGIAST